ncbi:hypothetical protein HIM_05365 [Hirsutella minnesotensis 3608]|uniref:Zn(2)-C6 fungal-type domain-containing protein n=1 Tax=Hirsutella minnesotensis 3608 TaxID=1043627 RepID=A0A0F7ZKE5_9HYPO|nr:hypothetical protein HIM_05365 [Hirsutella minnesotensis 3608]
MEPMTIYDGGSEAGTSEQRPQKRPAPGAEAPRRPKRGKYTPVACDECKKRKLKCIPAGDGGCERCVTGGQVCAYASGTPQTVRQKHQSDQVQTLSEEMALLRQQVADLVGTVRQLKDRPAQASSTTGQTPDTNVTQTPSTTQKEAVPKEPQFVGPTRPAFGLMVGERSLTRMGIPTYESPPASGADSPTDPPPRDMTSEADFWLRCTPADVSRLLTLFEEEVESVYPFIDISDLASRAQQILDFVREIQPVDESRNGGQKPISFRDVEIAKIAIAIALTVEGPGRSELATRIAESVEQRVSRLLSPQVELKEIQLLAMLSIYYFHCDEELLAWRTIGIAAREALEMGLHRRKSLLDNFKDPDTRRLATRVFWCVYVLDRRWSFGTSLSFALSDRDIDPNLPEPDADFAYLKCMVGYGRLCSKLWDAIPPLGSPSQSIPDETVQALDSSTRDWLDSIPAHLQLRHPRLGLATQSQSRVLRRLRAMLYLRANHTRISIYQHYLFSTTSITANMSNAWLVVNIAQDTVDILVHLNATTDIYSRQQNAFNYFLLSALAVIFLAVCHAPQVFTEPCRKSFLDAVDLVRGFSRDSAVSRRLWKSIRGLLPRLRALGIQGTESKGNNGEVSHPNLDGNICSSSATMMQNAAHFPDALQQPMQMHNNAIPWGAQATDDVVHGGDFNGPVPDMFQMRNDLLDLFDALGQGQLYPGELETQFYGPDDTDLLNGRGGEISRRLRGLI